MAPARLPAIVREGLVGLRHAVNVVLALVRRPLLLLSVQQLVGQALGHRLLAALPSKLDEPANGEGPSTTLGHLDWYLISRPADATRADLEHRGQGLDPTLEFLDGIATGALAQDGQRVID